MAQLVTQLGPETAAVFEGVLPENMREQIEALAHMLDITQEMVSNPKCDRQPSCFPRCMRIWRRARRL